MKKVIKCPDCDKLIATAFPLHNCEESRVKKILDFLMDRKGFDSWWEDIDTGIRCQIIQGLTDIINGEEDDPN